MWNTVAMRIRGSATELENAGEEVDDYVTSTSKLRDTILGYTGFDILDETGESYKDLYEIVLGIGKEWKNLGDLEKAALGEALGGKRNARGLFSIFDHLDTLTNAYESSVNSAGSAMKEQEHYAESVQYSIDRTKASLQELAHDFLSSDLLKGLIEGANTFLQIVDKIISSLGTVGTLLTGGGIASFVHGMATNKGLMAGLFENLASRNGGVAGSSMLSNILKTFTGGTAGNTVQKAGEGIARNIGEGIERRGSYHIGDAVTNALAAGFTREVIPYGDGDFVEVWRNRAGEIVQQTQGATQALDASLVQSATQSGTTAGTGFASAFASAITAHPLIASAIGIGIAAAVTAGIVAGVNKYQKEQRAKKGKATIESYEETKSQVEGYQERYITLKEGLDNAKTDADRLSYREQILSLQQEIVAQYGSEASAVDLVNGKLSEQVGIIGEIANSQMEKNMQDSDFRKYLKESTEEMESEGQFEVGVIVRDGTAPELEKDIDQIIERLQGEYGEDAIELSPTFSPTVDGEIETDAFTISGTKYQAKQIQDSLKSELERLSESYKGDEVSSAIIDNLLNGFSAKLDESFTDYGSGYLTDMYQNKMLKPQQELYDDYVESIRNLNLAFASGDDDTINQAIDAYAGYSDRIGTELKDFKPLTEKAYEQLDETSLKAHDLKEAISSDNVSKNNIFKDNIDDIKKYAEVIEDANFSTQDIAEIFANPKVMTKSGQTALIELAKSIGILGEDITADNNILPTYIDLLSELGIAVEGASDKTKDATQDFSAFQSSIINDIANIDTLNAAIAESFSGKGLSYSIDENGEVVGAVSEIKKAYGELMQEAKVDESSLFQSTALGLKTNQSALRALQSELEAKNKIELNNQLEEAQKNVDDLQSRFGKMDKEAFPERYDKLKGELDAAKSDLESVRELQAAYEGATSAYQKWVNAQSMGEEGDVYNAIRETAFKRGDELLEQGLVGTNEFRAIAQMFSDEDLSTAGIDKIISEYQAGSAAVKSFFTEGYEGLAKFGADAASKGIEGIREVRDEAGNLGYAFENVDVQKIADTYGVSASVIESIFGRMADYGIEVQRYSADATADLEKLNQKAKDAQEAIKGLDDTSVELQSTGKTVKASDIIDFNIDDLDTKTELENKISDLNDLQIKLGADTEEGKQVGELLDQLKQKKEAISQATNIPMGYSDLETANTAASQLKDRIAEISNSSHVTNIDVAIQNDEQVNTLAQNIASLPKEAQIEIGVKEENAGSAQAIIQQIQDNPASIKVTPELVKNDLDQEGTIKYSTEITKPLPESELNKKGTITYISKMGKALNPAQLNKKQTINQTTNVTKNETTNKTLNTTVTGNAAQESNQIRNAIASIPDQKIVVISAIDSATVKIQKVKSEKIKDKVFVIKATDDATAVVNSVKGNNIPDKSFNVTANTTTAINAVTRIKNLVDGLRSKEITITTKRREVNAANGTAHWQGTAGGYYSPKRYGSVGNSFINHYNGTAYARGNWGLKRDEPNALINELGPEIVVLCKLCYHVW